MSQIYTLDGDIQLLYDEDIEDNQTIFRKMVDIDSKDEITIANIIIKNQQQGKCQNIVKIYQTKCNSIDMELLDINFFDENDHKDLNKYNDIKKALEQLNKLGIAFIDLREDNIGYSHNDKMWKIFDFDSSGLIDLETSKWIIEPPKGFFFKQITKQNKDIKWFEFDQIRLQDMFKEYANNYI